MNELRFDAWTRRRFGVASGTAFVAALGVLGLVPGQSEAKHGPKKPKKRKKPKKQAPARCLQLAEGCHPANRQRCCGPELLCGTVDDFGFGSGFFCCKPAGALCASNADCCDGHGLCLAPLLGDGTKRCTVVLPR